MPDIDRALVVTAHPDDADFGVAGTIATMTDAGVDVTLCVVTDGQSGGFDRTVSRDQVASIRRDEQRAAAQVLGVQEVRFLGYVDGRLEVGLDLRRDLARVIREVRPDRVLCQLPVRNLASVYGSHPDHTAAGEATLCAVYPDARNPFAFPELLDDEGLEPHVVDEVWVAHAPEADLYLDVTDRFDRKLAALRCHVSQHPEPETLDARIREWMTRTAGEGGLPVGRLAEKFRTLDTR